MEDPIYKAKGLGAVLTALEVNGYHVVRVDQHEGAPWNYSCWFNDGRRIVVSNLRPPSGLVSWSLSQFSTDILRTEADTIRGVIQDVARAARRNSTKRVSPNEGAV